MFVINKDNSMKIIRGDTGDFEFTVHEMDQSGNTTPYTVVSGDTLTFTVKKTTNDRVAAIQKKGNLISESTFAFHIDSKDTECLMYGRYYYDIEFRRKDGHVDTLVGPALFVIKEEVTF